MVKNPSKHTKKHPKPLQSTPNPKNPKNPIDSNFGSKHTNDQSSAKNNPINLSLNKNKLELEKVQEDSSSISKDSKDSKSQGMNTIELQDLKNKKEMDEQLEYLNLLNQNPDEVIYQSEFNYFRLPENAIIRKIFIALLVAIPAVYVYFGAMFWEDVTLLMMSYQAVIMLVLMGFEFFIAKVDYDIIMIKDVRFIKKQVNFEFLRFFGFFLWENFGGVLASFEGLEVFKVFGSFLGISRIFEFFSLNFFSKFFLVKLRNKTHHLHRHSPPGTHSLRRLPRSIPTPNRPKSLLPSPRNKKQPNSRNNPPSHLHANLLLLIRPNASNNRAKIFLPIYPRTTRQRQLLLQNLGSFRALSSLFLDYSDLVRRFTKKKGKFEN